VLCLNVGHFDLIPLSAGFEVKQSSHVSGDHVISKEARRDRSACPFGVERIRHLDAERPKTRIG